MSKRKTIKIKLPEDKTWLLKETPAERKERISNWQATRTRIVENKKLYNRARRKREDAITRNTEEY